MRAIKPKYSQKKIISKAGLDPSEWLVTMEDASYLHLVDKGIEQREILIIDKNTLEVMKEKP